jgi:hypothetical protein
MLVPIREMTDVLSVESKAIDLSRDTWVRMKIGTYKGDLAKVWIITFYPMIYFSLDLLSDLQAFFSIGGGRRQCQAEGHSEVNSKN